MRKLILAILAVLVLTPAALAGSCPKEKPMDRHMHKALYDAHQLLDKDQTLDAAKVLDAFCLKNPESRHPQMSFMRGMLAYRNKKLKKGMNQLGQALEQNPCFGLAWRNLAVLQFEAGKQVQAATSSLKAYEHTKPKDPELLYQAAIFYLQADKAKRALPILVDLCKTPKPKIAWIKGLLQAQMNLKKWKQASATVTRLLAISPDEPSLWKLAAGVDMRRKRYRSAAARLEVAYRLKEPSLAECRTLADLYQASGLPKEAALWWEKSMEEDAKPSKWERLARLYARAGLLTEAMAATEKALDKPTWKRHQLAAELNLQMRRYHQAATCYTQAGNLAQKARFYHLAGQCALHVEELDQAEKNLRIALKASKADSKQNQRIRNTLSGLREYREQVEAANRAESLN